MRNRFLTCLLFLFLLFTFGTLAAAAEDPARLTLGVGETGLLPALDGYAAEELMYDADMLALSGVEVTALSEGETEIRAAADDAPLASVTVLAAPQSVSFPVSEVTTGIGFVLPLQATVNEGSASALTYSCGDAEILRPLGDGNFKAIHSGTCVLLVETYNGCSATCVVTVQRAPKRIRLNKTSLTLGAGESDQLTAAVNDGAFESELTFSSSDPSVVKVNYKTGLLRAKKAGEATVTVTAYNGVSASCSVTVLRAPKKIYPGRKKVTLGVGDRYTATYSFPEGSGGNGVTIESSDPKCLRPLGNNVFQARKAGTATLTYRTYNGKTTQTAVTVLGPPSSISLKKTSYSLRLGQSAKLKVVLPANTRVKGYTYTSSHPYAVTVDSDGLIRAVAVGSATVTVTTDNGCSTKAYVEVSSLSVPFVSQLPTYPTGCEAASCTALLRYYGFSITLDQMVATIPRKDIVYINGRRIGPDIHEYFVGNPRGGYTSSSPGYGAFAPCVTKSLQAAIDARGGGYTAVNLTGCSFDLLRYQLAQGRPLIVWATYQMMVPKTVNSWYIPNGDGTYRYFEYPRGTHVFVLKGYSESYVYLMDPYYGTRVYDRSTFEARWNLLGKQAIVLLENDD